MLANCPQASQKDMLIMCFGNAWVSHPEGLSPRECL